MGECIFGFRSQGTARFSLGGLLMGGEGEFLAIGYCLRKISYFSLLFSGNFWGANKALMEGTKS